MDFNSSSQPSSSKKRRNTTVKVPNNLTDEEMLAFLELSDDSLQSAASTDDEIYNENDGSSDQDHEYESENEPDISNKIKNISSDENIVWSNPPLVNCHQLLIEQASGLKKIPRGNAPLDYFNFLVDDCFFDLIAQQTNIYAEEVFLSSGEVASRITSWKPVTVKELRIFFGLVLHMGTIKINRLQDYWKTHRLFGFKCFSNYISHNRFLLILRCLHFSKNLEDRDIESNNRLHKVQPVINYFNEKMLEIYYLHKELSIDESMISWRGRLHFRQYLPGKRHKYGIKCYVLAEPNGLTLKIMIYAGTTDTTKGIGHSSSVVLHLMQENLDKGHALYMDNYYNSHDLAATLLKRQTYCTGTLRSNRKRNCKEVTNAKLKKGQIIEKCDEMNGIIMAKWHDKRDVIFISTEHNGTLVEVESKRGDYMQKPQAVIAYNKYMSGVDRKDQMLAYNSCDRKTIRWYKKVGIYTLQMLLLNSWFLYNKYSGQRKMNFYDYRLKVIENLVPPKDEVPAKHLKLTLDHLPTKLPKIDKKTQRKNCRVYKNKSNVRKMSNYCCNVCSGSPRAVFRTMLSNLA